MFACEKLELREGGRIAEKEIDVRISGERAIVEDRGALRIGLQFLVLGSVKPAKAKFELVDAFVPL